MKISLILLSLFLYTNSLISQTYNLIPDSCTVCFSFSGSAGSVLSQDQYNIEPLHDTLINGNTYVKINGSIDDYKQPKYIRQIGSKLYGLPKDSLTDLLIMDFDANINDTIYNLYSEGTLYDAVVSAKDSFLLNDGTYNTWMDLELIRIFNNWDGIWDSGWLSATTSWSERGLCNVHDDKNESLGGVLFNVPQFYYQPLEYRYRYPSYCTPDPRYTIANGSTCASCTGQSGYLNIENENNIQTVIYPNPVKENAFIDFATNKTRTISLLNYLGETLLTKTTNTKLFQLNIKSYSSGFYFMKVEAPGNTTLTPFVIE